METTLANLNHSLSTVRHRQRRRNRRRVGVTSVQFVIFDVNPSAVRVTGSVNAGSTFACNDVPVILAEPDT